MNRDTITNTIWMCSEKMISIIGFFLVTAYVSRYIGPAVVGQLAYIISIYQIVQAIAKWGGESIIFRRTSRKPSSGCCCLQTSGSIRLVFFLLLTPPVQIYFFYTHDSTFFIFSSAIAFGALFSVLDVYSIYYNARLMSKYNTIVNTYGLVTNLLLRTLIVIMVLNPIWLIIPILINTGLPYLFRRRNYKKNHAVEIKKKQSTENTSSIVVSI